MGIEEIEEYQRRAKDGDPVAKEVLTEFEKGINVEKDIKDVAVTTVKDPEIYKELSGYNDAVDTVNNILKGDYTEAAILAAGIILKPLKVGKHFDEILDAIEKNGGKAIVKDGKIYGKNKKGELVEADISVAGEIKGYTKHGLNQAISRNEGKGVGVKHILNAVKKPKKITPQINNNTIKYQGKKATVILNKEGKVVTTFGSSRSKIKSFSPRRIGGGRAQKKANSLGFSYLPKSVK